MDNLQAELDILSGGQAAAVCLLRRARRPMPRHRWYRYRPLRMGLQAGWRTAGDFFSVVHV